MRREEARPGEGRGVQALSGTNPPVSGPLGGHVWSQKALSVFHACFLLPDEGD